MRQMTLSVLVTREEYCEAVAHRKQKERRHIMLLRGVAGGSLIVLGIAGVFFGGYISLSPSAAVCLVVTGLFTVCYDGIFAPVFDKAAAAREFGEKQDLQFATTYTFKDSAVHIENGRIQGEISLSLLTRWSETPALFIMEVGRELCMSVPKRLMTEQQRDDLRNLLQNAAKDAVTA